MSSCESYLSEENEDSETTSSVIGEVDELTRCCRDELQSVLQGIQPQGKFATGGQLKINLPAIHLEGHQAFPLPLCDEDAIRLRDICEQAPYGRGKETVVDVFIRRAWQVDGSKLQLPKEFNDFIQEVGIAAAESLGVKREIISIKASLYKLILYEVGGHFLRHRDTEKEPGMFGTLVVQCPVQRGHTGGEFLVWHQDQREVFQFAEKSSENFYHTAFYADCEHELKSVLSGYRLCLVYNLIRAEAGSSGFLSLAPTDLTYLSQALPSVQAALKPWTREDDLVGCCPKLIIVLEHKYTETNLSFTNLKGRDLVIAELLRSACDEDGHPLLELHLAILTRHESGQADSCDSYFRGERAPGSRSHYMDHVDATSTKLKHWVSLDGSVVSMGCMKFSDYQEFLPPDDPFEDAEPDEESYEDYTGNAAPTLDYWYHAAVLVIWPRHLSLEMKCSFNLEGLVGILQRKHAKRSTDTLKILKHIVGYLERNPGKSSVYGGRTFHRWGNQWPGEIFIFTRLLKLAVDLKAQDLVITLLNCAGHPKLRRSEKVWYPPTFENVCEELSDPNSVQAIVSAVEAFSWEVLKEPVMRMVVGENFQSQFPSFVELCFLLDSLNHDAALELAQRILSFIPMCEARFLEGHFQQLIKLAFKINGCLSAAGSVLLLKFKELSFPVLVQILDLELRLVAELTDEDATTSAMGFIQEFVENLLLKLLENKDAACVGTFLRNVCSQEQPRCFEMFLDCIRKAAQNFPVLLATLESTRTFT